MSEEEKKAIEELKEFINPNTEIKAISMEDMKTLLNLIEKQQKEIENSINKDKIREKIKQINEEFENNNCAGNYGSDYYIASEQYAFCEQKLKELLEE